MNVFKLYNKKALHIGELLKFKGYILKTLLTQV